MDMSEDNFTFEVKELISALDIYKPLQYLLNMSGMLPPIGVFSSWWKYILYNTFSALIFLSFLPLISMQLMGIYRYRSNLTLVTAIIFQITAYVDGMVSMAYFIWNRKKLLRIFHLIEYKFGVQMRQIGSRTKQNKILDRARKFVKRMTITAIVVFLADMCTWCVLPGVVRYMAYLGEEKSSAESEVKEHLEYSVLVMWLPDNASKFPTYEYIYILQFFSVWGVVANYAAGKLIIVTIFYSISAQFEVLASAIEDIDEICRRRLLSGGMNKEHVENIRLDEPSRFSQIFKMGLNVSLRQSSIRRSVLLKRTIILLNNETNAKEEPTFSGSYNASEEIFYMKNSIRYHQTLLDFCKEVNGFLSKMLLFHLIIFQILMCLPPLQIILGQNASTFRFVSSIVDTGIWPFLICFWGEAISQKSLAVNKAAYGCSWYNSSKDLKKLLQFLLMRTKDPVRMTAGKFYFISLETFADIENKVYAYFTLLKKANSS